MNTLHSIQGKRLFRPSKPYSANTSICLFCEKKSVAKAKIFFLMIQSEILSRPRHPPLSFKIFTDNCSFFLDTVLRRIPGGFASSWLQAPNQSKVGRKSWTQSSSGKKSIFPQIARCSTRARLPAAGDASLTSSNSSPEIRSQTEKLLDRYENGRVGRAKADANASLEPSGSYFSPGMFPTTCPFPGGHPPLPRKWQVSFH